ncbi:membrane protein [Acetobacter nitrogenifigens DSM 23921 = NBRC 105050]|uniref:Membrane protein n=2 Tax=Acetobacter TaxID=434 RepID=A0A511X7M7_9PROT|nr:MULTISPECIES: YggT family protein [Acetobacter]MBO1358186.1 YggT family protein [Acetobacter sacchari]OUJ13542.1 hypothetical protein HK28_01915 [Acetobacter sp. DsW_063]GEN58954.1 membrane protein [Acetobacter nitrogenifigens DSM 23921 = NBRC 105050]
MLTGVFELLLTIIQLYQWVVIAYCVFSMLYAFGVLDGRNRAVWQIGNILSRLTEPALNPIRRVLPTFGNVDLAPLALLLGLQYLARPAVVAIYRMLVTGSLSSGLY